uniref:uncharacterized protein LOC108950711 n=1 Tax=Ciona intestinalis TaxID=7719 RepID=UPI000EF5501C|nr:uncharacterized protein LOC108950711 [Ciona intestinalis]|eukprot:XP_018672286.2 uncharacterized protein LOC108950711 [Ciona intestinalis]
MWLINYKLPDFPLYITEELKKNQDAPFNITSKLRKKVVQILFDSVSLHTLYPTSTEYRSVCVELIRKYPVLCDVKAKEPLSTWVVSLKQKFRDERRPMFSNVQVQSMKRKYGFLKKTSTPSTSSSSSDSEPPQARRKFMVIILLLISIW